MSESFALDKKRRPIFVGDVLKMDHFIGARRKRYYMYKIVSDIFISKSGMPFLKIHHLPATTSNYHLEQMNGTILPYMEIVQGHGKDGTHFEDRKKLLDHPEDSRNMVQEGGGEG